MSFQSKANEELRMPEKFERILFEICEKNATSIVDLAKCVVKLMNNRKNKKKVYFNKQSNCKKAQRWMLTPKLDRKMIMKRAKKARLHAHFRKKVKEKLRIKRKSKACIYCFLHIKVCMGSCFLQILGSHCSKPFFSCEP